MSAHSTVQRLDHSIRGLRHSAGSPNRVQARPMAVAMPIQLSIVSSRKKTPPLVGSRSAKFDIAGFRTSRDLNPSLNSGERIAPPSRHVSSLVPVLERQAEGELQGSHAYVGIQRLDQSSITAAVDASITLRSAKSIHRMVEQVEGVHAELQIESLRQ